MLAYFLQPKAVGLNPKMVVEKTLKPLQLRDDKDLNVNNQVNLYYNLKIATSTVVDGCVNVFA
jgi:hypothetical protein